MNHRSAFALGLLFAIASVASAQWSPIPAPGIDDMSKEWCFLEKSTTVIGIPYQPDVTQVSYDGALFTRNAELCFFYGPDQQPMMARQKTFLEGWIPIIETTWRGGSIQYQYEAFAQALPGEDASNTVNFVRVKMTNVGNKRIAGLLWSGYRNNFGEGRFGGIPFYLNWNYRTTDTASYRTDQLIYTFPPGGRVLGEPAEGSQDEVGASTVCGLAGYQPVLNPGESAQFDFKMPRVPVPDWNTPYLVKLRQANYDAMRKQTVAFWRQAVVGETEFRIPEPRVQNSLRASLVHMMLATRDRYGRQFQSDGLPSPDLFLTSEAQAQMAYDFLGRTHDYETSLSEILNRQSWQGIFLDTNLPQNGDPLIAAQGQTIHALSYHAVLTHDMAFAKKVFPAVTKGVNWIIDAQAKDAHGLMPPSWPYDNEMIRGRYTSHNLWCLLGIRSAIRLARLVGETEKVNEWTAFEAVYAKSIVKALHANALSDGSVPPGLYDVKTGRAAGRSLHEYQTNQDWENMLLAAPTGVLAADDLLLTATLKRLHATKFREGVMTYRSGMYLHQTITANVLEQEIALGDEEQALTDLYHMLLHNGSTGEGFESLVEPWTRSIDPRSPPPNALTAMTTALVIRNMLVVERGGKAGLEENNRDLYLFSLISPAWVKPGNEVGFRNALCEMGHISASLKFGKDSATLSIDAQWRNKPRALVMPIPWFMDRVEVASNSGVKRSKQGLVFSTNTKRLTFKWHVRPGSSVGTLQKILHAYRREPGFELLDNEGLVVLGRERPLSSSEDALPPMALSFEAVLRAYRLECAKLFDASRNSR